MVNTQTKILAIETSTAACSVAVRSEGEIEQLFELGNNIHSQRVLQMIADLLQSAGTTVGELDAVAVGQGPGSFTGLRIGVGVAQGIAYGAACPMIGVSSLEALAARLDGADSVLAGIDARMGQIYWARYTNSEIGIELQGEIQVSTPSLVNCEPGQILVGNAWHEYHSEFQAAFWDNSDLRSEIDYPRAYEVLMQAEAKYAVGDVISPIEFAPHYVRNDVAKKP